MTIYEAPLNVNVIVQSLHDESKEYSDLESRLMHFGFVHDAVIKVTKRAALFKDPLLVEVRGRLIALTKSEAQLVQIKAIT